jgi:dihydroxy-acid dehydratase
LVQTGDRIRLSVRERRLDLLIEERELEYRRSLSANQPTSSSARGYSWLYDNFVTQANEGCDFAFLQQNGRTGPQPDL